MTIGYIIIIGYFAMIVGLALSLWWASVRKWNEWNNDYVEQLGSFADTLYDRCDALAYYYERYTPAQAAQHCIDHHPWFLKPQAD
jgi:hypothetical protein